MMKNAKEIGFKQKVTKGNATFEFRESGHVIGGSTVLVESEKKNYSTQEISKQVGQECYEKWIQILEK
uniref:Beta-lactamase domain-containing protein n=1 Tax=uncultured marine thaumarchaeote SAT1000_10_G09 TaxID=1456375 RepID=A0A075I817_9ARCH|nr:beta-lactamase domain-containing protein [uncultured marine thaumarchaeote SAT1000_10_G09]